MPTLTGEAHLAPYALILRPRPTYASKGIILPECFSPTSSSRKYTDGFLELPLSLWNQTHEFSFSEKGAQKGDVYRGMGKIPDPHPRPRELTLIATPHPDRNFRHGEMPK